MSGRWPSNFVLIHSEGCEKIGVKRVKGKTGGGLAKRASTENWRFNNHQCIGYADSDGLETIDDWICAEGCPVKKLGAQSGPRMHGAGNARDARREADETGMFGLPGNGHRFGDKGTAARFYFQAGWEYEQIEEKELWNPR